MQVLVIDVGGTHVMILATGQANHREFVSGPSLTPEEMVRSVLNAAKGWKYEAVSIGYPGPVLRGKPVAEPHNLGSGWIGFDFETAFGCPVKFSNDAAVQALGSDEGGTMLFLGLGTGLGSAMVVDGKVEPMELGPPLACVGHCPSASPTGGLYRKHADVRPDCGRFGDSNHSSHGLHVDVRKTGVVGIAE